MAKTIRGTIENIMTIDTMGCQTNIANKIITKKADYILALKENQNQLHQDIHLNLHS